MRIRINYILSMKKLTAFAFFLSFLLVIGFNTAAQFKLPGLSNPDLRQALEKVLADYPRNFSTLKGEILNTNPQTVEYASLLLFKSAEQNIITKYSGKLPVFSWQAQMLTAEEYAPAEKKYRSLYKDLKNLTLTLNRDYSYGLDGSYDAPDDSKKFSGSLFRLSPHASHLPRVMVELSLRYEMPEWKVYLTVYQKEREDNEQGKVRE